MKIYPYASVNIFTKSTVRLYAYAIILSGDFMHYSEFDDDKKYIERIRALREDHDYSQQFVANYLHTSQTMYARYERDANAMPIRHLICLSRLYNVSSDYILGISDDARTYSDILHELSTIQHSRSSLKKYGIQWKKSV